MAHIFMMTRVEPGLDQSGAMLPKSIYYGH